MNTYNKQETLLLKKFNKCKTRRCSDIIKKRNNVEKLFEKEQAIKCPQKSPKKFYNCSSKFYEGSKLQKLSNDLVKCSNKKCSKLKKKLKTLRNKF